MSRKLGFARDSFSASTTSCTPSDADSSRRVISISVAHQISPIACTRV
jgi:hypothetical protein